MARAPHAPRVVGDAPVIAARPLLFTPPSGQIWRSYYYAGTQRIAVRVEGDPTPANNGLFYLLNDHLGSTSVTTDASGNKVAELRYYPYGQTRYSWNNTPTSHRFTGQISDEDSTGLYFFHARYYDGLVGRFLSADSIVPEPGNPQALNRYTFVLNNPLKYIDPTGHTYLCDEECENNGGRGTPPKSPQPPKPPRPNSSTNVTPPILPTTQILDEALAPDKPIIPWLPNPHIELSGRAAEANAGFVAGWDYGVALITTVGQGIIVLDTIAAPVDPAGKAFGYFVVNVASVVATVTWLDTAVTSGPNSRAFAVNTLTYTGGWASAVPYLGLPLDLATAWGQFAYDAYTLDYIERHK